MSSEPKSPSPRIPLTDLAEMKARGDRIVMITAYDAPSARLADAAGVDLILVGDSAGNTLLGYDTTVPATLAEMLMLSAAAARGRERALLIADMPFGSFQVSDEEAVRNAVAFTKADADAVKLEGAGPMLPRVRAIVGAGIPVMGHIGLTPQSATMLGGFKAQGRTGVRARALFADALALQQAGCFAIVLEAVPARVAGRITAGLRIPTIGIGAGVECDGQVLVWHDLLGIGKGRAPRFVKRFAEVGAEIQRAIGTYAVEVRSGAFPGPEHTYNIPDAEFEIFSSEFEAAVPAGEDWL